MLESNLQEQALADQQNSHSKITGEEFTQEYFTLLKEKFKKRTLTDHEFYDLEVCKLKFNGN